MEPFPTLIIIAQILATVRSAPSGRNVPAWKEICDRFPWMSSCQESAKLPPMPNTFAAQPQQDVARPELDFCAKYSWHHDQYCKPGAQDGIIVKFCISYKQKCSNTKAAVENSVASDQAASKQVLPTFEEMKKYCGTNKAAYAKMCLTQQIASEAQLFCRSYSYTCPGSPDPGQGNPTSSGQVVNAVANGQPPEAPQSSNQLGGIGGGAFPMDGDFGSMLGIPTGGDGPARGLGSLNNLHVPQYGGPVKGGLGLGQSFFAPFFGANKGSNISPLKNYEQGESYNFAGMSAGGRSGVDWSGLPGLGTLNYGLPLLGRRK